jgi:hypothetical protein
MRFASGLAFSVFCVLAAWSAPGFAQEVGSQDRVKGFEVIKRAPTPGERVARPSGGMAVLERSAPTLGIMSGPQPGEDKGDNVRFSMNATPYAYEASGFGSARANFLLGDGVRAYDADALYSRNYSYYSPYEGYRPATPRLNYNESYLRYLYRGSVPGLPSTAAPIDFMNGRR